MIKFLRRILLPLGWLYGSVVESIKLSYRLGWRTSKRSEVASIVVGNLSVGGTGKTPHVEYIITHLRAYHNITVISRGYGRKTKGLFWVNPQKDSAAQVGDEPLQIARKFPVSVIVCEKRLEALAEALKKQPQTQLFLLDDAMQHWPLRADCYVMLSTYSEPFFSDFVLPAGNLREFRCNYRRANIIIITKCPSNLTSDMRDAFLKKLSPKPQQKVFFSYFKYGLPYLLSSPEQRLPWDFFKNLPLLLVCGIAQPKPLEELLAGISSDVQHLYFPDHHPYSQQDWQRIEKAASSRKALILTTEKDATRLLPLVGASNIYILPIEVEIAFGQAPQLQRALVEVMYKKKGYPVS